MICTTIQNRKLEKIFDAMDNDMSIEMAEIRLDRCSLSLDDIDELFSQSRLPLVATCRTTEGVPAKTAEARLLHAIKAGATYVDLEIEAPPMMSKRIRREAAENGCGLIRSFHDFEGTDSLEALKAIFEKCTSLGADIVKIVTTARSEEDVRRVMSLYDIFPPEKLIAFCMGDAGRNSRVECLSHGAPFSYACLNASEAAAPGQWISMVMSQKVYGRFPLLSGTSLKMPCSKSFAQRAVIAAALADGVSDIHGYTPCSDNESSLKVAKALGAEVGASGKHSLKVSGMTSRVFSGDEIHTGESGFLTRIMIPILSAISSGPVTVTGEKTLLSRPLKGAREIMGAFGVTLESSSEGDVMLPAKIVGHLTSGKASVSGKDGSQLISGLLYALPLLEGDSELTVTEPKSIPYLFMTLDVLKRFGIEIECEMKGGEEFEQTKDWELCTEMIFHSPGGQHYRSAEIVLEGDWSVAADFAVAGAVYGDVSLEGLDLHSLQADLSIIDILDEAGACVTEESDDDDNNPEIHVQKAPLHGFAVDISNCPDLFPALAVLAAFSQGTSTFLGVARLATKESDRRQAVLDMLSQMGVPASAKGDSLSIEGRSLAQRMLTGTLLRGGNYTSHHDHRMVMALSIAGIGADSPVVIDDTECVAKSCPGYFSLLDKFEQADL
jgi:3-phosphoshikimate 1-carboxyvinyltransferase